jgi:hypothetical protein
MSMLKHAAFIALPALVASSAFISTAVAQEDPNLMTKDDVIVGTMNIDFKTRTQLDTTGDLKQGSAAINVADSYKLDLIVADTTQFAGEIQRFPKLYSSVLGRNKQDARLYYNVSLSVLNPRDLKQKKTVGKWVGTVPVDPQTGAYDLAGGSDQQSALRVSVDAVGKAAAFQDTFGGKMMGKAEKKEGLGSSIYKRVVGNKTVEVKVTKSDPMSFNGVMLAKGPAEIYPKSTVNGKLDYDYETGNYYADNIKIRYTLDGKEVEDVITGTIKWVEDPDRATNGKGYYDFNLRFNEEKNKPATTEGNAFEAMSDEDAFFAVDNSIPSLTGKIEYVDTFISGDTVPASSKVTYKLNANKLTKQQVVNFFKLWLIAVGPTNDE